MARPTVELAGRWLLGGVFLSAAVPKMIDPAAFAKIVYGYDLVPDVLINLVAIGLPFIEFIAGAAMIVGGFIRPAVRVLGGLLLVFIGAIAFNWIRGHTFDCGCFSITGQAEASTPGMILLRDLVLLTCAVIVERYPGVRRWLLVRST